MCRIEAYDSVPRSALWSVLVKCRVPPTMLNIIQSFHDGKEASVRVRNGFEARNGLNQGCRMAPITFTLMQWYLCGMSRVIVSIC